MTSVFKWFVHNEVNSCKLKLFWRWFFFPWICVQWYSFRKGILWKLYKQQKIEKVEINMNCIKRKTFIFLGIKSWEVVTCEGSHLFIMEQRLVYY
jgi:hypothetical protein